MALPVTHETFPVLILWALLTRRGIWAVLCQWQPWLSSGVSLSITKSRLTSASKKKTQKNPKNQNKKKTIPNNPKFLAEAGTLTEILAIFRVFADLFFCL